MASIREMGKIGLELKAESYMQLLVSTLQAEWYMASFLRQITTILLSADRNQKKKKDGRLKFLIVLLRSRTCIV